jgi:hypothetical protein
MSGGYGFGSERRTPIVTKTGNYTATTGDYTIICNGSSALTITMPTAASMYLNGVSHRIEIKRKVGSAAVTIDGNGSETIDGLAGYSLADGEAITIVSDGSALYIV